MKLWLVLRHYFRITLNNPLVNVAFIELGHQQKVARRTGTKVDLVIFRKGTYRTNAGTIIQTCQRTFLCPEFNTKFATSELSCTFA